MKKLIAIIIVFICLFPLAGCWSARNLSDMSVVAGIAVDKGENGSKYRLTIELVDLTKGEKEGPGSKIIETDGDSIFDAIANAHNIVAKELYFSNCAIAIISRDVAKEGVAPVLDWLVRNDEMRPFIHIMISLEKTAGELLKPETPTSKIHSYELDEIFENNQDRVSKAKMVHLYHAVNDLGSQGLSLTLPCFKLIKKDEESTPKISGTAILKEDRLQGFLNEEDTKYFLFAIDEVSGGTLVGKENDGKMNNVTLKIKDNNTSVTPEYKNGKLKMHIKIKTSAEVEDLETSVNNIKETEMLELMEMDAEKMLSNYVLAVIKKVQSEYDSDIFGFGNTVYKNKFPLWVQIKPKWNEIFKTLDINVSADVSIKNTGELKNPLKVSD